MTDQDQKWKMMDLEKRIAEIEYRTAGPQIDDLKCIVAMMKENGIQRINCGPLMIEMPYHPVPLGYATNAVGVQVTA